MSWNQKIFKVINLVVVTMRITVDTSHDSHEDIKKVIKMLQHLVGDSQEIFTNQPEAVQEASPMANIFGDISAQPQVTSETTQETQQAEETSESTEDLFAELFGEEELKKMNEAEAKSDEEDVKAKPKDKKFSIEFY